MGKAAPLYFRNMEQLHRRHVHPSSPRSSSGGADSTKGSPDTRLTAFSPDEGSTRSFKLPHSCGKSGKKVPPTNTPKPQCPNNIGLQGRDPFMTADEYYDRERKLSPTASPFHPFLTRSPPIGSRDSLVLAGQDTLSYANHISTNLSHENGLSRYIAVSSVTDSHVTFTELDSFFVVS
jgi:hypothetical protein